MSLRCLFGVFKVSLLCLFGVLKVSPLCLLGVSSESINWALRSAVKLRVKETERQQNIITCGLEHPAVLRVFEFLRVCLNPKP